MWSIRTASYNNSLTVIIKELEIIVFNIFFSCIGLAKSLPKELYLFKSNFPQISVCTFSFAESVIYLFFLIFHE